MNTFTVGILYIRWLYREGIAEFFRAWMNYHWFLYHFFSVPVLVRTFFAPWRRMQEMRTRGFDPERIAERLIINTVLRFTGIVIRSVFLIGALAGQLLLLAIGAFLFVYFIASPVLIPATFLLGILLLL